MITEPKTTLYERIRWAQEKRDRLVYELETMNLINHTYPQGQSALEKVGYTLTDYRRLERMRATYPDREPFPFSRKLLDSKRDAVQRAEKACADLKDAAGLEPHHETFSGITYRIDPESWTVSFSFSTVPPGVVKAILAGFRFLFENATNCWSRPIDSTAIEDAEQIRELVLNIYAAHAQTA